MESQYISSFAIPIRDMLRGMDTTAKEFGQRLRELRDGFGLKQPQVAQYLSEHGVDIGQTAVSHYETGRRYPDPVTLALLVRLYETSADYVLGLTDNSMAVEEIEKELAESRGQGETDQVLRQLSPARKEQVLTYAKYLLSLEQSQDAELNQRRWSALLNVLERRLGPAVASDVLAALDREFPDFAALVRSADAEDQRLQKG